MAGFFDRTVQLRGWASNHDTFLNMPQYTGRGVSVNRIEEIMKIEGFKTLTPIQKAVVERKDKTGI